MSEKNKSDLSSPDSTVPPDVKRLRDALRGKEAEKSMEKQARARQASQTPATDYEALFPHAASQKSRAEMASAEIGQVIGDKGIYVGTWQPQEYAGKSLSQVFYVFAAPEDLVTTFKKAAAQIGAMEDWHHQMGLSHPVNKEAPDTVLYKALYEGRYQGEWFIPPFEILKKNLYENRYLFKESAGFSLSGKPYYAQSYFSCTPGEFGNHAVRYLHFNGGLEKEVEKTKYMMSVRPVRLEPVL